MTRQKKVDNKQSDAWSSTWLTELFLPAQCKKAVLWLSPLSSNSSVIWVWLWTRREPSALRRTLNSCSSFSSFSKCESAPPRYRNTPSRVTLFNGMCCTVFLRSRRRTASQAVIVNSVKVRKKRHKMCPTCQQDSILDCFALALLESRTVYDQRYQGVVYWLLLPL